MDFRDYPQKYGVMDMLRRGINHPYLPLPPRAMRGVAICRGQDGAALFMTMMFLVLLGGFSILMFENAMLEKMISGQVKREVVSLAMADGGVDQVLSWFDAPADSPDADFFQGNRCADIKNAFSASTPIDFGKGETSDTLAVTVSKSNLNNEHCQIQILTNRGKGVEVEVGRNPMPKITDAVQGVDNTDTHDLTVKNIVVMKVGDKNGTSPSLMPEQGEKELDPKLMSFIKRFGRHFTAFSESCLIERGLSGDCKSNQSFQNIFSRGADADKKGYDLVLIEADKEASPFALEIASGHYKGYYYFTGDIRLEGGITGGKIVRAAYISPDTGMTVPTDLANIHLDGLFYTTHEVIVDKAFNIYGAIYAGKGFRWEEDCVRPGHPPCLQVWYNSAFENADYAGVVPMIRVPGTWRTM